MREYTFRIRLTDYWLVHKSAELFDVSTPIRNARYQDWECTFWANTEEEALASAWKFYGEIQPQDVLPENRRYVVRSAELYRWRSTASDDIVTCFPTEVFGPNKSCFTSGRYPAKWLKRSREFD